MTFFSSIKAKLITAKAIELEKIITAFNNRVLLNCAACTIDAVLLVAVDDSISHLGRSLQVEGNFNL